MKGTSMAGSSGKHKREKDWRLPLAAGAMVGIVGVPPLAVIRHLNRCRAVIRDLDEPQVTADLERVAPFLPRVYCAILRTVVLNALHLELAAIYIDVGRGKCDAALHTATVLEEALDIPIIRTENRDDLSFGTPICESGLPLVEKMERITAGVQTAEPAGDPPPACRPTAGFWGVPPRDFSLLSAFPDTTHVYGFARCMENKTPADHALEAHFNPEIPTVFFAQSFCAKTALARLLAARHPCGLYLDIDVHAGSSAKAKVEAFLELTRGRP